MTQGERIVFEAAIEVFGKTAQLDQVTEECAELIIEIAKIKRGRHDKTFTELAGEVADVSIMLDQLLVMGGEDFVRKVETIRSGKIARLTGRVANAKA